MAKAKSSGRPATVRTASRPPRDLPSRPDLGAAVVPAARPAVQAAPRRLLCLRHAPRRHRRTLVRLDDGSRQREPQRRRRALSYCRLRGQTGFLLRDAVAELKAEVVGERHLEEVPALAGVLEVLRQHGADPAPHAPERRAGREGRPAGQAGIATTSRRSSTPSATTSPTPSWAWNPARRSRTSSTASTAGTKATTASSICSKAYRLKPGTGWLVPPCVLHAPGSLVTYEPQWGSDVFGMYQSMVEGRHVPRSLLTKDFPEGEAQRQRLPGRRPRLGGERRPELQGDQLPGADRRRRQGGWLRRRWIVYGKVNGEQLFTAKELTLQPGAKCDHQGRRRVRADHRAGQRHDRQA